MSNAPIRMLLCDDAEPLRKLYRLLFDAESDFEVVGEAGDGAECIEVAGELQPDLVLLDLAMPRLDGLEAIPHIRVASPDSLIVMCTAMMDDRARARALQLGAVDYIEKGLAPIAFVDRVRAAMRELVTP